MYQLNPLLEDFEDRVNLLGTVGGGIAGKRFLDSSYDDLMGTVTRYHNTSSNNVASIKDKGILSKFSTDPNNITNKVVNDVPMKDKEGLVYLSKNKKMADSVGKNRGFHGSDASVSRKAFRDNPLKTIFNFGGKTLKVRMSPEEYAKLIVVDNPEVRGAKTPEEFYQALKKSKLPFSPDWDALDPITKYVMKSEFDQYKNQVVTVRGNISPEHIVGSKHYKNATNPIKWAKYVKDNPGKFAKGVGKATAAVGSLAAAGYLGKKVYDKHHQKEQ